jgi:hypothetical protein
MERRFSERRPATQTVLIYDGGVPIAVGRARDISLLGMFVEVHASTITKHRVVELEFTLTDGRVYRIPGMVARRTAAGLGLILETADPATREAVRAVTRDNGPSPAVKVKQPAC